MHVFTGQIIEVDNGAPRNTGLGYLEQNRTGGGVMTDLLSNDGTFKTLLLTTDQKSVRVSLPCAGFISLGHLATVVVDDDGCETFYTNHSTEQIWCAYRAPADTRRKHGLVRFTINWGLFMAVVAGFFASLANWESGLWNALLSLAVSTAGLAMVWSMTARPIAIRKHAADAQLLAKSDKSKHASYIAERDAARLLKLQDALK